MNIEAVRDLIPSRVRLWIYAVYVVTGITIGAISAYFDGNLEWLPGAERVLAYLAVPLALLAAVNTTDGDEPYAPQHAADW